MVLGEGGRHGCQEKTGEDKIGSEHGEHHSQAPGSCPDFNGLHQRRRVHRDHAAANDGPSALVEVCVPPWKISGFSGDIKGLDRALGRQKAPFLLA